MPKPPKPTNTESTTITEPTTPTETTAMTFDFSQFASNGSEVLALDVNYGTAHALNAKESPNHGYFVPIDSMQKSGFRLEPNHTNRYSGTTGAKQGYVFNNEKGNPRILVLAKTFRAITLTKKGFNAKRGEKEGQIFGFYETAEGKALYDASKKDDSSDNGLFTLTTIYLVYFLDSNNKPLHDIPIRLSLKGAAAVSFGEALNAFRMQGAVAFSEKTGQTISNEGLSLLVFEPVIEAEYRGEGEQSLVSVVKSFTQVTAENLHLLFAGTLPETQKLVKQFRAIEGDDTQVFTQKVFNQYVKESGFHQLAPGVEIPAIAPANETGEDVIDVAVA